MARASGGFPGGAGLYRSAFYFFKQALQLDPALSQAHTGLAEVYRKTGHADWAAIVEAKAPRPDCIKAKKACAFAAGQPGVASSGSNSYWRVRGYNELARRAFLRLGEIPESVELHVLQAEILTEHSKSAEAVAQLRAARKLAPSDYRVARQLAVALHPAKDYDAAIVELEQIVKQEPTAPDLQFYLGDCWLQKAQPVKAIPYLQAAVKLDPSALPAQAALGTAFGRLGRHADAIPSLPRRFLSIEDGSLHYQLSRALQAEGQTESRSDAKKVSRTERTFGSREAEARIGSRYHGSLAGDGSRIVITWFIPTSFRTCFVPLGHFTSSSVTFVVSPSPKWRPLRLQDA